MLLEEEPNLIIYNLIKEVDCIIENSIAGNASNLHHPDSVNESALNLSASSIAPNAKMIDGRSFSALRYASLLPAGVIEDYQKLLEVAIEIFKNNFSPADLLMHNAQVEKLLLESFALENVSPSKPHTKTEN